MITASSIVINQTDGKVYKNEQLYTGTVWSNDKKSMAIDCDNGIIKKIKLFHDNGNIAAESESFVSEVVFFDSDGNSVDFKVMGDLYPDLMNTFVECMEDFSMDVR